MKEDKLLQTIRTLEEEINENRKENINNIADILGFCDSKHDSVVYTSIKSLARIFQKEINTNNYTFNKKQKLTENSIKKKENLFSVWLEAKFNLFIAELQKGLNHEYPPFQITCLNILLDFSKNNKELLKPVVTNFVKTKDLQKDSIDHFADNYLKYDDILEITMVHLKNQIKTFKTRENDSEDYLYFNTLQILEKICKKGQENTFGQLFFSGEENQENPSASNSKKRKTPEPISSSFSLKKYKKLFTNTWLQFLKLKLPEKIYKKILIITHDHILPFFTNSFLLMDFLKDSYDQGGLISVLSLSSIFVLITEHNLDYPEFYEKLYVLFEPDVFLVSYRNRFFQLAKLILHSKYISAYLVAAFIKKLARLSLKVSPHSCLLIISFIYNLFIRHPATQVLIHKTFKQTDILMISSQPIQKNKKIKSNFGKSFQQIETIDPYNFYEPNPSKSNALDSSLWEIFALKNHWFGQVAKFSSIFERDFKKKPFEIDQFVSNNYKNIFDQELKRKNRNSDGKIPLEYRGQLNLFGENDIFSSVWLLPQTEKQQEKLEEQE